MTTGATGQLGLALPVQGELSGTWGDTVNNGITQYTNIAIAATLTLTNDGAVTLANTTGDASASNIVSSLTGAGTVTAQFAIVKVTGTLTTPKIITAPSYSKTYIVVNAATGSTVSFIRSGQTPAVSIAVGESAFVYYNGTDYVKVSSTVATGVTSFTAGTTGLTPNTATTGAVTLAGTLATANGGTNLGGATPFTSGGVVYASSTSALATGSALTFDGANLGIAATVTGNSFTQYSNSADGGLIGFAGNAKALFGGSPPTSSLGVRGESNIVFGISSTEAMRLTSTSLYTASGINVGFGLSNPVFKLDVDSGATAKTANFSSTATTAYSPTSSGVVTNCRLTLSGGNATDSYSAIRFQQGGSFENFFGAVQSSAGTGQFVWGGYNGSAYGEWMRLSSAGNLGLGTNAPNTYAKLAVRGYVTTGSVNYSGLFSDAVNSSLYIGHTSTTVNFLADTAITFNNGSPVSFTEKARISTAGGFSVGTTADPGAGAIYATGNITAYYSDARLKTVSGKIENALDKVAQLSGVYYTNNSVAKSFGYDSDEVQVGVLAQDVEAVLPQIVKAAPFDLDEHGNSKSGENYKTVQYERLVPLLIEAINELQAKVKALEAK
jgi:hypothetical protein